MGLGLLSTPHPYIPQPKRGSQWGHPPMSLTFSLVHLWKNSSELWDRFQASSKFREKILLHKPREQDQP